MFTRIILFLFCLGVAASVCPGWAAPMTLPGNLPGEPVSAELESVLEDLGKRAPEVIDIQRELVARPALNPEDGGEGEEAKARWIEDYLRQKGLPQAERIDVPDERVPSKVRPNLIVRHPGASERTLWIIGHLDSSPPGNLNLWTGSPWALRIVGDKVYGRGVEDNHQAITTGLLLLESLSRNRVTPPMSLGLVLHSAGKDLFPNTYGLAAVLETRPDLFKPGDLIVVSDHGNAEGSMMEVAEKGMLWLKFTITGKQSHSAAPQEGLNALDAGAGLIADLRGLYQRYSEKNPLFDTPMSTFVPTKAESSDTMINQMPGEFIFHMDCRLIPPYTADEVQSAIRALADAAEQRDRVTIRIERVRGVPTSPITSPEAPVVQAMFRAVRAELGVEAKPEGVGGLTAAAELRARGLSVLVWAKQECMGLAVNEYISITSLLEASKIFARILFDPEAAAGR